MADKVYQSIELTGTSSQSVEDAVNCALAKCVDIMPEPRWFEIVEMRGAVSGARASQWQVTVKIGCSAE